MNNAFIWGCLRGKGLLVFKEACARCQDSNCFLGPRKNRGRGLQVWIETQAYLKICVQGGRTSPVNVHNGALAFSSIA